MIIFISLYLLVGLIAFPEPGFITRENWMSLLKRLFYPFDICGKEDFPEP